MLGVGWPIEEFPPAEISETDLWTGLICFVALVALGVLYIWRERRSVRKAQPEPRIEHPALFRKAA
jgi:hypothetical protein